LPNGTIYVPYNATITVSGGGTPPYTFAVTYGTPPSGLTLSSSGTLSGTPNSLVPNGSDVFDVQVTDAHGCQGTIGYNITISCPTITLNPGTLPACTDGSSYNQTITASGGNGVINFAVTSGSLPNGLSLSSSGSFTGTPAAPPGTYNFTVTGTEANDGCTGSQSYSLTVNCPTLTVSPSSLPSGTAGAGYNQTITASGGSAPYTFSVTGGGLPAGLTLASSGSLSGTPTTPGDSSFAVTATASNGCTGNTNYTLTVTATNLFLPVYQVIRAGATYSQAINLANLLNIPTNALGWTNGIVSFLDSTNWMAVPSITITNTSDPVISNLIAGTQNPYPAIPISVQAIDFATLSNLSVFDTNQALIITSNALENAGLHPQGGTPLSGHTILTAFMTNANATVSSVHQYLDTLTGYELMVANGTNTYPLVGAGASVQVDYGPTGNVTRLYYSAPQLVAGPSVQVMSQTEISNRIASVLETNAQFNLQLVYWAPSSLPRTFSAPTTWTPTNILPWYAVIVRHPPTSSNATGIVTAQMIPATDDTNYVPLVNLSVSQVGTQVVASASAVGGLPPYTYVWGGSSPAVPTNIAASISYTPVVRVAPPPLAIALDPSNSSVAIFWPYPSTGFVLESATIAAPAVWSQVTTPVETNSRINSVTIATPQSPGSLFFRLRLANQMFPVTETVAVTVTDANGISVHTSRTVATYANPAADQAKLGAGYSNSVQPNDRDGPQAPFPTYGTESPYGSGSGFDTDTAGWLMEMSTSGANQVFLFTQDQAWPGDFIEPPQPGGNEQLVMPFSPTTAPAIYADAYVNTANMVHYLGHGNPTAFSFTYPNGPLDPNSLVWAEMSEVSLLDFGEQYNEVIQFTCWDGPPYTNPASTVWYYDFQAGANWSPNPQTSGMAPNWGNLTSPGDSLFWLIFESCEVMTYNQNTSDFDTQPPNSSGFYAWEQWGPQFNGLHSMLGYDTIAYTPANTPAVFADIMLNGWNPAKRPNPKPLTLTKAWILANRQTQTLKAPDGMGNYFNVSAAAMGPVGTNGVSDFHDYFPGKGNMGPSIPPSQLTGWWYLNTIVGHTTQPAQ
jgi:Family of unknown function (DUF6345)/Putative Ig domain